MAEEVKNNEGEEVEEGKRRSESRKRKVEKNL